jgi:thymidine phosphorylase
VVRAGQVLYRIHADYPSDLEFARHAMARHCGVSLGLATQIPQVFVES